MKSGIRVLLVDDEALARKRLRTLLSSYDDIEVIGEAADGESAISAIRSTEPDLVFLDIEMPLKNAFDVIAEVGADRMPAVVFATAYDHFALAAFEADAIDYLVKPVDQERLERTLQRARSRIRDPRERFPPAVLEWLADHASPRGPYRDRVAVRLDSGRLIVRTDDILWVEAANNYVRIHLNKATYLHRANISEMEEALNPASFLRVHRSHILNINAVVTIQPWGMGEFLFVLSNGAKISSSRRYRIAIQEIFGC